MRTMRFPYENSTDPYDTQVQDSEDTPEVEDLADTDDEETKAAFRERL